MYWCKECGRSKDDELETCICEIEEREYREYGRILLNIILKSWQPKEKEENK